MANENYSFKHTVSSFECDINKNMTMGAILRVAQQAALDQCTNAGVTDELYKANHCVFLLAKCVVEYYKPIKQDSIVKVTTCPGMPQRAAFFRYTYFEDESGEVLAALDSRWVLVDTESKRILRHFPEDIISHFNSPAEKMLDLTINKADVQVVGTEKAAYTRCDSNGHLNNTQYADIMCDYMPIDEMCAKHITRFAINYHREVPIGESFTVSAGKTETGSTYFIGNTDDTKHFEAEITL